MHLSVSLSVLATASLATAQWTQLTPATSPPPCRSALMAFDSTAKQTLLFGGVDDVVFPPVNYGDTWRFSSGNWTKLVPLVSPPARYFGGMAYDANRQVMVLYGGKGRTFSGDVYLDDTWEWYSGNWTQVATTNTPNSLLGTRGGVGEVAMAYEPNGKRIVLFGGEYLMGFVATSSLVLEYDGTNWTKPAIPLASQPPRRSQASLCTAASLGGVLLTGGTNFNNPAGPGGAIVFNDTWVYNSALDTWTKLTPAGPLPQARAGAALLYDSRYKSYVLHGGYGVDAALMSVPLSDTWLFDGTSWSDVSMSFGNPTAPLARFSSAEGPSGGLMLFGGRASVGSGALNNNTWEQGRAGVALSYGSGCAGSAGVPQLAALTPPSLGTSFDVAMSNLVPGVPSGIFMIGYSNTFGVLGPLPFDLQLIGLGAGCQLLCSADIVLFLPAVNGVMNYNLALPVWNSLLGYQLYFQGVSLDAAAPKGFVPSNGLAVTMGY